MDIDTEDYLVAKLPIALRAAGVAGANADMWAHTLDPYMWAGRINNQVRIAAFIAQMTVESWNFTVLEENLHYSQGRMCEVWHYKFAGQQARIDECTNNPERLANYVYAGVNGNGGEQTNDGYNFRGGGLLQLTGRGNYAKFAASTPKLQAMALADVAAYVRTPTGAAESACWYWGATNCNALADAWFLSRITKAINGPAMLELQRRVDLTNAVYKAIR